MKKNKTPTTREGNTTFYRSFNLRKIEETESGAIRIAISSEEPYPRMFLNGHDRAYEVLGHKAEEIDMSYFKEGAPLAVEHDIRDQVGVLENVTLDNDGVIRADVRFSRSVRGQEIEQDVKDGIRTRISVGYSVLEFKDVGEHEDGTPIVRATSWRPYEASIVAVPADITVGVGKTLNLNGVNRMKLTKANVAKLQAYLRELDEGAVEDVAEDVVEAAELLIDAVEALDEEVREEDEEVREEDEDVREEDEEERDEEISEDAVIAAEEDGEEKNLNLASKSRNKRGVSMKNANGSTGAKDTAQLARIANEYGRSADLPTWLEQGRTVSSVMEEILDGKSNAHKATNAGLSRKESKDFNYGRAVAAFMRGDNSLVNEMGVEEAKASGVQNVRKDALYIPLSRVMTSTNATAGQALTAFEYLSFEEALREQSVMGALGTQIIQGQNNILTFPRSEGVSAQWVAEDGTVTAVDMNVDDVELRPKQLVVDVAISNVLAALDGTYSATDIVRQDILGALLEGAEAAYFEGTGGAQPVGLFGDADVPSIAAAAAATPLTFERFVAIQKEQRENKGQSQNTHFVMSPSVYALATTTPRFGTGTSFGILHDGQINGVAAHQSNFVSGQKVLFGNFTKSMFAYWGALEIVENRARQSNNRRIVLEGTLLADGAQRQGKNLVRDLGVWAPA